MHLSLSVSAFISRFLLLSHLSLVSFATRPLNALTESVESLSTLIQFSKRSVHSIRRWLCVYASTWTHLHTWLCPSTCTDICVCVVCVSTSLVTWKCVFRHIYMAVYRRPVRRRDRAPPRRRAQLVRHSARPSPLLRISRNLDASLCTHYTLFLGKYSIPFAAPSVPALGIFRSLLRAILLPSHLWEVVCRFFYNFVLLVCRCV